jgi:hypothetical protein
MTPRRTDLVSPIAASFSHRDQGSKFRRDLTINLAAPLA